MNRQDWLHPCSSLPPYSPGLAQLRGGPRGDEQLAGWHPGHVRGLGRVPVTPSPAPFTALFTVPVSCPTRQR